MDTFLKILGRCHRHISRHSLIVVVIVAFALFMDYLVYGLVIPLTPHSPAGIADEHQTGLLYGAYGVGVLLATPLFGYLGDRFGCRKPMIWGVLMLAIATFLFCLGTNFYLLVAARFLQGVSAAASWTAGMAMVAEHFVEKRVQMLGFAMIGSTAGSIVGPTLGGWLYDVGGYYLPFLIVGLLIALDALMRITLLPKDKARTGSNADVKKLLTNRSVIVAAIAVALAAAGWGLIEPILPNQLTLVAHSTPSMIGFMFTVSTIAYGFVTPVVGRISDKITVKRTIVLGMLLMALTLPLLSLFAHSVILTGLMLCLVSMAYAFALNPTSAELGNAVDRLGMDCYAMAYAVYNIAYSVGMIGSDVFAAEFAPHMSLPASLLCMSAVYVVCVPFFLIKGKDDSATAESGEPTGELTLSPAVMA